jgi:predicted nucleotidyltransferase
VALPNIDGVALQSLRKIAVRNYAFMNSRIEASPDNLAHFCSKWKISELSLFGSVLREDFRPDSDIDVLAIFTPEARWSLFSLSRMQDELSGILGRSVDLVDSRGLRNPYRRREILATKEVVYAA